jgi:predicted transposase YdaD
VLFIFVFAERAEGIVQFQKDERLYERLFGELFLYFYRNRERFQDWQAVLIYPTRSKEQGDIHPYRALLSSEQNKFIEYIWMSWENLRNYPLMSVCWY